MKTNSQQHHRCAWSLKSPLMMEYHDHEWGVPVRDDKILFEFLVLESAQAGLSWQTVLQKRDAYRKAFDQFNPKKIACYGKKEVSLLVVNPGIIRNRLKILAAITNAKVFLEVQREHGSFSNYIWDFVNGQTINHKIKNAKMFFCTSKESELMSSELRKRGFTFVGSKICYSFMQAVGMVNDHEIGCFRHHEVMDSPKNSYAKNLTIDERKAEA